MMMMMSMMALKVQRTDGGSANVQDKVGRA